MARRVFYSFHYSEDAWRTGQVRNIGAVEGNKAVSDNDWEEVKKGGERAIEKWINKQLEGRSCTIVLIGSNTAKRKWINYEIIESWKQKKGIVGIHIHNLLDLTSSKSTKGLNPFDFINYKDKKFSETVKTYDPPYSDSKQVYNYIASNLLKWVEEAIAIRNQHS